MIEPRHSIVEELAQKARDHFSSLESLWNEIGIGENDRAAVQKEISNEFEKLLQTKLNEAKEEKATMNLKIRLLDVKLTSMKNQLGEPAQNVSTHELGQQVSLKEKIEGLEMLLTQTETLRDERYVVMTSLLEELKILYSDEFGVLSQEQEEQTTVSIEMDLSPHREGEIRRVLSEKQKLQEKRTKDIKESLSSIKELLELMGNLPDDNDWRDVDVLCEVDANSHTLKDTGNLMKRTSARLEFLQRTRSRLEQQLSEQREEIAHLLQMTKTPPEEQDKFVSFPLDSSYVQIIGRNQTSLDALKLKLDRLLPELCKEAAERLAAIKAELKEEAENKAEERREPSVEELRRLKDEEERLSERLGKRHAVLKQIERREAILKEAAELRNAATDPSRLLDRGGNSFRVRQQEERRRNMVSKELPKVTDKLMKMVNEWEESEGEHFLLLGRRFLEIMEEEREREERERDEERLRREEERQRLKAARASAHSSASCPAASSPCPVRASPRPPSSTQRKANFATVPQRSPLTKTMPKSLVFSGKESADKDKENHGQTATSRHLRVNSAEELSPRQSESSKQEETKEEEDGKETSMIEEVNSSSFKSPERSELSFHQLSESQDAEAICSSLDLDFSSDRMAQEGEASLPSSLPPPQPSSSSDLSAAQPVEFMSPLKPPKPRPSTLPVVAEEETSSSSSSSSLASASSSALEPELQEEEGKREGRLSVHYWDYLGDNYYTPEEHAEVRREVMREMEERQDELKAMAKSNIKFKKGELLGAGSFGQVFLGLNEATGELLAVKEVDCSKAGESAIAELEAEIKLLQQLRHPNIVAYYGVQRDRGISVLVEYCAGGSIASVIATFGALNEQVVRSYTRQILLGLDYLHKHCILHRDVKCANVLLDADGNVKVADFGASRNLSSINGEAAQMSMKGTPFFMAPEVIKQSHIGRQSDLWSLGCCVVEMCTSKPPFANQFSNVAALFWHIVRTVAPPVLPPTLSQECQDFCALCFRRDPERPSARRLLRHPFVAKWNVEAKQRNPPATGQSDDTRLSVAGNRRISALF